MLERLLKIRIKATGVGDSQSFVDFLKNYNFSGGRLITSDKVQLDPNFSGSIIIDLTFYNKNSGRRKARKISQQ